VELLSLAAIEEGKYAQGFPSFGTERRGAPVTGFNRVDDKQIKIRSGIYHPDVVVVLDKSLVALVDVCEGLKPEGILLVNTTKSLEELKQDIKFGGKIATVDATGIAWKELGVPITNTTMLGALLKVIGSVKFESLTHPIGERFGRIASKNMAAAKAAYDQVQYIN
jgi:pyruvate ferredoxin oxidoreductase gamma subunit